MPELPEHIRAFISIGLPEEVLRELSRWQQRFEDSMPPDAVRWSAPEQVHLTLRFLGNIPSQVLAELEASLRAVCQGVGPLHLRAEGLGGFPSLRQPRVIWVGLQGDLEPLEQLKTRIEQATGQWGEPVETRKFHPHLTLGRVREAAVRRARQVGEALQAATVGALGEWRAEQVLLMRSQLSPHGATHSVMTAAALSKG